jgi:Ala-tRNA(Pro) deacylase
MIPLPVFPQRPSVWANFPAPQGRWPLAVAALHRYARLVPATPETLLARLAELGIEAATRHHAPVFTVAEAQALRGDLPGGHCKSLFLRDRSGGFWLAVLQEDRKLSVNALARAIGAPRVSFATPPELMQHLGVVPGAVTPFGLVNDVDRRVTPVLDAAMLRRHAVLNFHPLDNRMTTAITPADLLRFIAACGHTPRLIELAALEPAGGAG